MRVPRSRFATLVVFGAVFMGVATALRVALTFRSIGDIDHRLLTFIAIFGVGLFFDLVTYSYVAALPALFLLLIPDRLFCSRAIRWAALGLYFLGLCALLFNACAEWLFWDEFQARYNFVAVDYLVYTGEVLGNIVQSYPVASFLIGIAAGAAAMLLLTRRAFQRAFDEPEPFRRRLVWAASVVAAVALSLVFVDNSRARVSENAFVNELASNGIYSFGAALRMQELDYDRYYPTMDRTEAFLRLREMLSADNARFADGDPFDVARKIVGSDGPEQRLNVLFIVVESLSAKYLGIFGHPDALTPNLDVLSRECLFFRNAYATGTRTNRGLEAIMLSLPPTPGRPVVQREHNNDLFSIGPIFTERGYETKFIYAGYGLFDNMNAFFRGNGFGIVDRTNFDDNEITFANVWGVCDEDLYARMFRECDGSVAAGKRFCSVVLTTSNHRPFTYPEGRVDLPPGQGRAGALKYTDWALGDMLRKAKAKPWFKDTIFVILADHCANSAGKSEISVAGYHIPVFIYAPGVVKPRTVDTLVSQMDVTPTVLGLLKFSYTSRFFGRDLLSPGQPRAFLSNYQKVGLFTGDHLALLMPDGVSRTYRVAPDGNETLVADDAALRRDAISFYQCASYLLEHHLYRPASPAAEK